jgi:uncharacterized protein with HEPN domain
MSSDRPRSVRLRILDMLDAIARIRSYTNGLDALTFSGKQMVVDAVIRNFGVLGEAARHVPEHLHSYYSDAPWHMVIGIRNRVIHDYSGVDPTILWDTMQHDLPALETALRRMLQHVESEQSR